MSVIIGSYSHLEKQLIVGAYYSQNQLDQDEVQIGDIARLFDIELNPRWIMKALEHFVEVGWSDYPTHVGEIAEQGIGLTAAGLREAERLIESNAVVLNRRDLTNFDAIEVPASDRVVQLNHNQIQIAEAPIGGLVRALEEDNGDPDEPGLRDRLLGQIKAGRELIRAGEFRAFLLYEVFVKALSELVNRYKNPTIVALANALLGAVVSQLLQAN